MRYRVAPIALVLALTACAAASPAPPPELPPSRAARPPPPEPAPSPHPADEFSNECPPSERPMHVVLDLDRDVDWARSPEDVTRDLVARLKGAAVECRGASVAAGDDGRSLSVVLPEPCGADRLSGKLELALLPFGAKDFARAAFDGKLQDASVAGRAFVQPAKSRNKACVTLELDHFEVGPAKKRAAVRDPPPTPGDRWRESMRVQRAVIDLFFPPLLLFDR